MQAKILDPDWLAILLLASVTVGLAISVDNDLPDSLRWPRHEVKEPDLPAVAQQRFDEWYLDVDEQELAEHGVHEAGEPILIDGDSFRTSIIVEPSHPAL